MYYLIHTIYRPCQIFQRYIFTRSRGHERMVRDMACGEDSKRIFQGWSIVIITRRKTTKMETLCLKTTIYSRRELLNSVLPAMPHVTWYHRPRVINLLQSSPFSQLGTPRKVTKWKWYPCNGFCILLLSVLIFSWSIRCYYPWGSNINQCDFLIRAKFPSQPENLVW